MKTVVQKWGNDLVVRIPAHVARKFNIKVGSTIDLIFEESELLLKQRRLKLADMIACINEDNLHHIILDGDRVGEEAW